MAEHCISEPKILLVYCAPAGSGQCTFKFPYNFLVTEFESPAQIRPELILKAFSDGFDGVMILDCSERESADEPMYRMSANRIALIKLILDHFGFDPVALVFKHLSLNDTDGFRDLVAEFIGTINDIARNNARSVDTTELKFGTAVPEHIELEPDAEDDRVRELKHAVIVKARALFDAGAVDSILVKKIEHGRIVPALFHTRQELDELVLSPGYNLAKVLRTLTGEDPNLKIGVVAFPCEELALNELVIRHGLATKQLEFIKVTCTEEQGRDCNCELSYPGSIEIEDWIEKLTGMERFERYMFWRNQFAKCIKCYGCRDICPVCCSCECSLEDPRLVPRGTIPPPLAFHLIRFYHLSDRCIGCGECEAACPVDIPLSILHHQIIKDMRKLFGYEAGFMDRGPSPLEIPAEPGTDRGGM